MPKIPLPLHQLHKIVILHLFPLEEHCRLVSTIVSLSTMTFWDTNTLHKAYSLVRINLYPKVTLPFT